jgi:hypothetical protein
MLMLNPDSNPDWQAALRHGANGFFRKEFLKWDEIETLVESMEQIS